jgi:hypothetical protein
MSRAFIFHKITDCYKWTQSISWKGMQMYSCQVGHLVGWRNWLTPHCNPVVIALTWFIWQATCRCGLSASDIASGNFSSMDGIAPLYGRNVRNYFFSLLKILKSVMFSGNYYSYVVLFSAFAKMLGMRRICRHTLLLASQVCVCVCERERERQTDRESTARHSIHTTARNIFTTTLLNI